MKSSQSGSCEFCGFHATESGYSQHFAHLQREHGGNVALMEECQRVDALLVRERVTPALLAILVGSQMTNEATRRALAALLRDGAIVREQKRQHVSAGRAPAAAAVRQLRPLGKNGTETPTGLE